MATVFITGSADGLGRNAARALLDEGHRVVLHARNAERAKAISDLAPRALGVVLGDLSSAKDVRSIADQVNALGRMDAVIHNAGVYSEKARGETPEGHARLVAINTLAPYLLTAWLERADRYVFLSSGLHRGGGSALDDLDWKKRRWDTGAAYAESKLHVTALSFALARRWPEVKSHAVNPGWVPTKMGGAGAPDDLEQGHLTQTWLATSEVPVREGYWFHRQRQEPAPEAKDVRFQEALLSKLAELTGVSLLG
jgi:NAD(P)-dependent dehydrogenase (short-subunit alcohol dehydrogenase family)